MSMSNTEKAVKDNRRKTRRNYSTEEKIRIVLDGLRGEISIAELCRREGINTNLYYRWSKDFLEAGKKRLAGDMVREANTDEIVGLKRENKDLKQAVAELYLRNDWLKKSLTGQGVTLGDERCTARQKNWPLSGWWRSQSCPFREPCGRSRSAAAVSTVGTGPTNRKVSMVWRIKPRRPPVLEPDSWLGQRVDRQCGTGSSRADAQGTGLAYH